MPSEVFAGITAFKTLLDITKSLSELDEAASSKATLETSEIIKLQTALLTAQHEQLALVERVGSLKERLAEFENWESEAERYELQDIGKGSSAYVLKPEVSTEEKAHYLCATCFQNRKKSILQPQNWDPGRCQVWICAPCGSFLYTSGIAMPQHAKLHPRK
ncbi:hypothetical protein [Roseibium sp.]|uniref:hypothetical protein n=1 Tax=Roseibium sp. TaxID=1936156 RepID=UPI003B5257D5